MKTNVKTTIKGNENLTVKNSVESIFEDLASKHSFIKLNLVSHDGKGTKIGIKKTCIKMFKEIKS